jgi:CheY-like chemotaxis protein
MRVNYILIAEDDEDDQYLLTSAFKEIAAATELVFVQNGIELVNFFAQIESGIKALPSLLVVDLNMPKKTGKEALRELINKPCFREFPTIVFSTTGNEVERKRCAELGITEYFVKPSNYGNLLQLVGRFQELAQTVKAS